MAYGIRVVQEMSVFPGLVVAAELDRSYPAEKAVVHATGPRSILVTIDGKQEAYSIRPFVYF